MLDGMLPEIQHLLNHYQYRTTGQVSLEIENDSFYAVHSHIKTDASGPAMSDIYQNAFPRVGQGVQNYISHLNDISRLLQQPTWPYCGKNPPCRRPNSFNRADLTINYIESLAALPAANMGTKLFSIPMITFEVEGGKDTWGRMEQQAKAVREICVPLAVMPEAYLVFVYPAMIEIWKAKREPGKCAVELTAERIHLNEVDRSLKDALEYFHGKVVEILIRQLHHCLPILELSITSLRANRNSMATGHTRNLQISRCCDDCYFLRGPATASGLRQANLQILMPWE